MYIQRSFDHPVNQDKPLALAIGNFDGMHLGHQQILKLLTAHAADQDLSPAVMIFEPQPREFFKPDNPEARLQSWHEKALSCSNLGIERLILCTFNNDFRRQSARTFCEKLKSLGVVSVLVGDDFRFGHGREGDANFLSAFGFNVIEQSSVKESGLRVSSTLIRQALAANNLNKACELLGRSYSMQGRVEQGDRIGRTLGFPTANIRLNRPKPALHGIYAASVTTVHSKDLPKLMNSTGIQLGDTHLLGAAHIGLRPAIDQDTPSWRFEVFLPEFSGNLYGVKLEVTFKEFIHGEVHYSSLDELKAGIEADVDAIKALKLRF